jgi:hypothetical protein
VPPPSTHPPTYPPHIPTLTHPHPPTRPHPLLPHPPRPPTHRPGRRLSLRSRRTPPTPQEIRFGPGPISARCARSGAPGTAPGAEQVRGRASGASQGARVGPE